MQKITPFLWFNDRAEEAMNFYVSIFKNSRAVSIKRYPDGPLQGPMKGMEGKVLTAVFELEGQRFMALDGGPFFKPTGAVSFYVECQTQEEVLLGETHCRRRPEGAAVRLASGQVWVFLADHSCDLAKSPE